MITTDKELELTRQALRLAESALASYRRDILPHNERNYRLFSATTIDLIYSIRGEIDEYLGIVRETELMIALEGFDIFVDMTPAGIITRAIDTFRHSLGTVIGVLDAETTPGTVARPADWIDRLCDLTLGGVGTAKLQVSLDLPIRCVTQLGEDEHRLLQEAVTMLFDALAWAAEEQAVPSSLERLPPAARLSVMGAVARLAPLTGPVERIVYRRRSDGRGGSALRATLTQQSRQRVRREMDRLAADLDFDGAEGVIRQIDLDGHTFTLRERPDGLPELLCAFRDDLAETVKELLDCRVKVSGLLETNQKVLESKMKVAVIELVAIEEVSSKREELAPAV